MLRQRKMKVVLSVIFVSVIISAVTISASAKLVVSDTYKLEVSKSSSSTMGITQKYDEQEYMLKFSAYPTIKKVSGTNVSSDKANVRSFASTTESGKLCGDPFTTKKENYTFYSNMTSGPIMRYDKIPEGYKGQIYFYGLDNYVRSYYTIQQFTK